MNLNRLRLATASVRGRILFGFALITLVVLVTVVAGVAQLVQVRAASAQIAPNSLQTERLQAFALAISAFEGDLDRYFVIGGREYRENVQADLEQMVTVANVLQESATDQTRLAAAELATEAASFQAEGLAILAADVAGRPTTEINLQIIELYRHLDAIKGLQQELTDQTLAQLQDTAATQQSIIAQVLTQFSILGAAAFLIGAFAGVFVTRILAPIGTLTEVALDISGGNLERVAPVQSSDELGTLAHSFNSMTSQLRDSIGSLEQRVQERTEALTISAEVGRRLVTILDIDELVSAVVQQVRDAFDYYHVHIYLLDETSNRLAMASGTGEAGQQMLEKGHQIEVGMGLVGRAAANNAPVLVPDVTQDRQWLPNPLLPDTRAEAAVPIAVGNRVLGVLDVQQNITGGLTEESIELLQTIANQVAIALQNARLFAELQEAQEETAIFKFGIDQSSNIVFLTEVDGTIRYVNPAFERIYGYSAEEAIGQTPRILKSGVIPAGEYKTFWETLLAGQIVAGEIINKGKDGRLIPIEGSNNPIVTPDGKLVGFLAWHTDITQRKRADAALAKQAQDLQTLVEVSTAIATILDQKQLLQAVADLSKGRFGLYHSHIYLVDDSGANLVLAAGAGEVGRQMVADNHLIPLGMTESLVARAARQKAGVVANDTRVESGFLVNPLLPDTRAEMAVPILVGEQLLGVLDLQANSANHFTEQDMQIQTTLAAQTAIALQNARYFTQAEQAVSRLNSLTRRLTREGWTQFLQSPERLAYGYDRQQVAPLVPGAQQGIAAEATLLQSLQVQGEDIGALSLTEPQKLTAAAREIVAAVAARLGDHLENLRLTQQTESALQEAERRSAELSQLNQLVATVSSSLDIQENLNIMARELARAVNADTCGIALFNPDRTALTVVAEYINAGEVPSGIGAVIPIEGNLSTQQVLATRQTLVISNAFEHPLTEPIHDLLRARQVYTIAILPIIVNNEIIGTVGLDVHDPHHQLEARQLRLAETIILQVSTVIQNARLYTQLEERAEELAAINRIAQAVSQQLEPEQLLQSIYENIQQVMQVDAFTVSTYDAGRHLLTYPYIIDKEKRYEQAAGPPRPGSLIAQIINTGTPILLNHTAEERDRLQQQPGLSVGDSEIPPSTMFVPLLAGPVIKGAMSVQSYRYNAYTEHDLALLSGIANHVAVALENARLYSQAQRQAQRERMVNTISQKIQSTTTVESALKTAVQELGQAFRARYAQIELAPAGDNIPDSDPAHGHNGS